MDVARYLDRIRYEGTREPTAATLRAIHRAHAEQVPFENLDVAAKRPIVVDEARFVDKVVARRRGGFCYELNGAFAALLREIGFRVQLLSARVANEGGGFGAEFDHLALRVEADGEPWLADVGFGDFPREPLRLTSRDEQRVDGRAFQIHVAGSQWTLLERYPDGWRPRYAFTVVPRRLSEFAGMCAYHQSDPRSSFTRGTVVSRYLPSGGRVTLTRDLLIEHDATGARTERALAAGEFEKLLSERFGLDGA